MKKKCFLILGGDARSLYLGEYLEKEGLNVCYYAFDTVKCFESLNEALKKAENVILPLPLSRDGQNLYSPLFSESLKLDDITDLLTEDHFVFAGNPDSELKKTLQKKNIRYCDYYKLEDIEVKNVIPTAEGLLGILINELPVTVNGLKCAVLGYGKIGRAISDMLAKLGADVTVFARKDEDRILAASRSLKAADFNKLCEESDYSVIINTVPARVLGKEQLMHLDRECVLIEAASSPFGIDFQAAKEIALTVIKAAGLPGKTAPKTAGEIIGRSLIPIINNEGLII